MPAYKLCPRCQLNYILENEDYCSICRDELRGIKVEEEDDDIYTKTCNYKGDSYQFVIKETADGFICSVI